MLIIFLTKYCEADSQKLLRGPLVLLQCISFYLKLVSSPREHVKEQFGNHGPF